MYFLAIQSKKKASPSSRDRKPETRLGRQSPIGTRFLAPFGKGRGRSGKERAQTLEQFAHQSEKRMGTGERFKKEFLGTSPGQGKIGAHPTLPLSLRATAKKISIKPQGSPAECTKYTVL